MIVALLVTIVAGLTWYFCTTTAVVDLVNWEAGDAQVWAKTNGVNIRVEQAYNDEFAAGKVISQDMAKGTRIKKGSFIKVSVSLGHDPYAVLPLPDFMSMTKDDIDAWVVGNFMANVRIVSQFSDTVTAGNVISFEVKDDSVVGKTKLSHRYPCI